MVTGVSVLRVSADDVLEHVAHLDVVDRIRIQIQLGELLHHAKEPVVLVEVLDLFFELQLLEYVLHVWGERIDVKVRFSTIAGASVSRFARSNSQVL